jgi:hypothetical protein
MRNYVLLAAINRALNIKPGRKKHKPPSGRRRVKRNIMKTAEDFLQIESSQRQHFDVLEHQERMNTLIDQRDFNLFSILKPKFGIDGDQYYVLFGADLQSGVAGFGDTLFAAIINFNLAFTRPVPKKKSPSMAKESSAPEKATEARLTDNQQSKAGSEDSTQICPHFDRWTILDSNGVAMYKIPACISQGKLLPC